MALYTITCVPMANLVSLDTNLASVGRLANPMSITSDEPTACSVVLQAVDGLQVISIDYEN
jgi:hypothetical protein